MTSEQRDAPEAMIILRMAVEEEASVAQLTHSCTGMINPSLKMARLCSEQSWKSKYELTQDRETD